MSLSHALVVDDSRSARVALKKLLEEHQLQVSLASSGEEAIDFLSRQSVDVVFMDHTMPGMDGLEAVKAIKSNPATATIPVMMYTTREGEVYVGQARALGPVGVMPKNVQPHQLFEMLASLGLVKERRNQPRDTQDEHTDVPSYSLDDEDLDQQAMGISLQNVVGRILEDQHLTLRSDILRSQRTFAKQVAKEIVLEQARAEEQFFEHETKPERFGNFFSIVLIGALILSLFMAWQFKQQRDGAVRELAQLSSSQAADHDIAVSDLQLAVELTEDSLNQVRDAAFAAVQWAVNRGHETAWDQPSFDAQLADTTAELMTYLGEMGFSGTVTLTSHLGQFCLMIDAQGEYQIAPPQASALDCDRIGHPLETSTRVNERLSVPFSRLYREHGNGDPLNLVLEALNGSESVPVTDYPSSNATAAEWNQIARINNRVVIELEAR